MKLLKLPPQMAEYKLSLNETELLQIIKAISYSSSVSTSERLILTEELQRLYRGT